MSHRTLELQLWIQRAWNIVTLFTLLTLLIRYDGPNSYPEDLFMQGSARRLRNTRFNESINNVHSLERLHSNRLNDVERLHSNRLNDVELFFSIANKLRPISDKVTKHKYSESYGTFLLPFIRRRRLMHLGIKFLEIGLGCDMNYGPGSSVKIWKELLRDTDHELWEAEIDNLCVDQSRQKGLLDGINVLVGDQRNTTVLKEWLSISKGQFNIIIDDGGHAQDQIYNSFMTLWPALAPGGLYFIEDLQVCRLSDWKDESGNNRVMMDLIHSWNEQLVTGRTIIVDEKIPKGVRWIFCQSEMCVIAKCDENVLHASRCS